MNRIVGIFIAILLACFTPSVLAYSGGTGTSADPYQIASPADWQQIMNTSAHWSSYFILTANIDLLGVSLTPVGTSSTNFKGNFDGKGHVISNATINLPNGANVALFGYLGSGGKILNLGVEDAVINGNGAVGGVVGSNNSGTITSCYATGDISGTIAVGGLTGYNYYGTITSCFASGLISSTSSSQYVGGLTGWSRYGTITACYASGGVSGTSFVGGLIGCNDNTKIISSYASAEVRGSSDTGGLIGKRTEGFITSCFWDMQTSGQTNSAGGMGLTTDQMKSLFYFQNAGWSAYGWVMEDSLDYPRLSWEGSGDPPIPAAVIPLAGSGTTQNPYQISSPTDWLVLVLNTACYDKAFILMADIDLFDSYLLPVGSISKAFTGSFNGNGHVIRNATIIAPNDDRIGLFGYVYKGGQIINLGVENVMITGRDYVGGLAGDYYNIQGPITSCYVTGTVSGGSYVGILAGENRGGTITSCYTSGTVSGGSCVGGLVGYAQSGTIKSSFSSGEVNSHYSGGLVGRNEYGLITSCYATGSVNGISMFVGGLVGDNSYDGKIQFCYATGSVIGSSSGYGNGLVGVNEGAVTSSFWDIQTTGQMSSAGGKGLTTQKMKTLSTFQNASWFGHGWVMEDGADYPRLPWEGTSGVPIPAAVSPFVGSGTEADPYQIRTPSDFALLSEYAGIGYQHLILMADLDMTGVPLYPIGDENFGPYIRIFNGNGHVIKNAVVDLPHTSNVGLFGYVGRGGEIMNLGVENATITGKNIVGGLVAYNYCGIIESSYTTGTINGSSYHVGGLVGMNEYGKITSCYTNGKVTGNSSSRYIGGLIGQSKCGTIISCYAKGSVNGGSEVGGLVGLVDYSGTIMFCYANGAVIGTSNFVGGLVGNDHSDDIVSCYATGSVNGGGVYIGGLLGRHSYGTVTGSFWDTQTSGKTTSAGGTGVVGKTTAEMKTLSTFTGAGWDFTSTWAICEGTNYPRLKWQIHSMDWLCPDNLGEEDLNVIRASWLSQTGSATWDSRCDLNQDGKINSIDLLLFRKAWAQQQP